MYRLAQVTREHHRPVRGAGRAVRPRVRRPARQPLVRRRAGQPHVLRPRPDRPAAAPRRLPGARPPGAPRQRRAARAHRDARPRDEGRARRAASSPGNLDHRRGQSFSAHAVVLGTGGYGNVFFLSTNAKASNVTAIWRAHQRGALMANPCFTQIHPTCIPASDDFQSKLTLMSESLRNDGRVWVPAKFDDPRSPDQIPESRARLLPRAPLPRVRQPRPARRRVARRSSARSTPAAVSVRSRTACTSTSPRPIRRLGKDVDRGALRQPHPDVRAHHRRGPVPGAHAHLPRRSTTRWAGSGWTTT